MKTPIATLSNLMFVRDTGDQEHHMTLGGWTGEALCWARPYMRTIGWTMGKTGSSDGLTVCEDCRTAMYEAIH